MSSHAFNDWNSMFCTGVDSVGRSIDLSATSDSPNVTINGNSLRIVGKTRNDLGFVTEDFALDGILVYDSLAPISKTTLDIYQFNARTEEFLAYARLNCSFKSNNPFSPEVKQQRIFNGLKDKSNRPS